MVEKYMTLRWNPERMITRAGWPIARIDPQGHMKRITLLDGTFYFVCSRGRYSRSGKHPCDVITHPDSRWFNRIKAFWL